MALVLAALVVTLPVRATDIIQTLAGGGSLEGYKPTEVNLALNGVPGLAVSPAGEVYVSSTGHHQVIKINTTTGQIQVVAGNGSASFSGDNFPATSAGLNSPGALCFDATGSLYIVDRGNLRVRRVDALSGIITTVAGNGLATDPAGNPAVPLGDGGPATAASFGSTNIGSIISTPAGLVIADTQNHIVRRFTVGGNIATIAGTLDTAGFTNDGTAGGALTARLNNPEGLAVDAAGNIYIGDSGNRRVRRLDSTSTLNTVVGSGAGGNGGFLGDGGPALSAEIGRVSALAFDKNGRLLLACDSSDAIRAVDIASATPIIVTIAGQGQVTIGDLGPATTAVLSTPTDIALDALGNLFILDTGVDRVRRVDAATGFIDTVLGTGLDGFVGDRGPGQFAILRGPTGAAFDSQGNLYIVDNDTRVVRKLAADGTLTTFAGSGADGDFGDGGPAFLAAFSDPTDVLVTGNVLYITDTANDAIRAVDLTTNIIKRFATVNAPRYMALDPLGLLHVTSGNEILQLDAAGVDTSFAGGTPSNNGGANPFGDGLPKENAIFNQPHGIVFGGGGELYVADLGNQRIRMISAAGVTSTLAGSVVTALDQSNLGDGGISALATFRNPVGVALTSNGNALAITDSGNQRIRVIDLATTAIVTMAGTGVAGFSGDGDLAINSQVNFPQEIFSNLGDLVFADRDNNRVRRIVSATDIDVKLISLSAKLNFAVDKKTGQIANGKDSVALKAGLPLPAGISAANLLIKVELVDLRQQVKLDEKGKQPKAVKASKTKVTPTVFDFKPPAAPPAPVSKFSLSLKGVSVAGAKPTSFSFGSKGTFRNELGRAGLTNETTPKEGKNLTVRVNITLGSVTFTGVTTLSYKATQGKSGSAKSLKPK